MGGRFERTAEAMWGTTSRRILCAALAACLAGGLSAAQTPKIIAYQGYVVNREGTPLEGDHQITIHFTDGDGVVKWSEVHPGVPITAGQFDVLIGSITPLDAFLKDMAPGDRLQIAVDGEALTPSSLLTSVPFAVEAQRLGGRDASMYLRRNEAESTTADATDSVFRVENTGDGRGLTAISMVQQAIYGKTIAFQAAVEGEGAGSGAGLRGSSIFSHGTIGYTTAADKGGVFGNSPAGTGVWGNSSDGYGVYGHSAANHGVYGHTVASNEGKPAVYGWNEGAGDGVYGRSQNRHGVVGLSLSPDAADAGVYARNDGAGPAMYSAGKLYVEKNGVFIKAGDLHAQGAFTGNVGQGGAPFPRPAFDSGWIEVGQNAFFTLGVGQHLPTSTYNNENFVVDLMTKAYSRSGNYGVGVWDSNIDGYPTRGVYYQIESNNDISIKVEDDEDAVTQIRLRIWYYR